MSFLVLPPEVNAARIFTGAGTAPLMASVTAWEAISSELASAASAVSCATTELTAEAWRGLSAAMMHETAGPYADWLAAAAAEAERSAGQARSATAAFELAQSTMVNPATVADNRIELVALVRTNLLGFNGPAIAATEAEYADMWAHAVAVMAGYHEDTAAAVAELGGWENLLQRLAGLPGNLAEFVVGSAGAVGQHVGQAMSATTSAISHAAQTASVFILGSPAGPPVPASQHPTFAGSPSLLTRITTSGLWAVDSISGFFSIGTGTGTATVNSVFLSSGPPTLLSWLLGEHVTRFTSDGMTIVQISPSHPSGHDVIAIHGGAYIAQPTIVHWLDYSLMAFQTGTTVQVPMYPLIAQGGTAATVVPALANFISSQIATHGASSVSLYGDSSGGGLALSTVEYMVAHQQTVPSSMVLLSPWLDLGMTNPNIPLVSDPVFGIGQLQAPGRAWAGTLPLTNPLVSPVYGSLRGLPPTYVYSGSADLLAPDVLVLAEHAAMQNAPISFVLRAGGLHDWALLGGLFDFGAYRQQIYGELGL